MSSKNKPLDKKDNKTAADTKNSADKKAKALQIYNSVWFTMGASALIGAVLFIIVYGAKILDPTNEEWLFQYSDVTQHYLGWLYYRNSPWQFPLGMIEGLLGDIKVSIIYTDSAPLYSLFFKILSPILPKTFQYIGLIGLVNFMLNGSCGSLLIRRFSKDPVFCILGSILFTLSPQVLHRLYGHETLASHYIITLGFILWAYQDRFNKKKQRYTVIPLLWGLLSILAVGTHMYFLPMILCAFLGSCITDLFINKDISRSLFSLSAMICGSLFTMWIFGALAGTSDFSDVGFCDTSANLTTFWNPIEVGGNGLTGEFANSSIFLKPIHQNALQYEGFAYLGLGVMTAVVIALGIIVYCLKFKKERIFGTDENGFRRKKIWLKAVLIVFFLAFFVAVSPKAYYGETLLYEIHYPDKIMKLLATFRASGRFAWVCDYIFILFSLYGLSRLKFKQAASGILAACIAFQITDISGLIKSKRWYKQDHPYVSELKDPRWEKLAEGCTKIIGLPYNQYDKDILRLTIFAYKHNMTINHFYVARPDMDAIIDQFYRDIARIRDNKPVPDALYIFIDPNEIPKEVKDKLTIYELDGYTVVKCPGQYDPLAE